VKGGAAELVGQDGVARIIREPRIIRRFAAVIGPLQRAETGQATFATGWTPRRVTSWRADGFAACAPSGLFMNGVTFMNKPG